MWDATIEPLAGRHGQKYHVLHDRRPVRYADVFRWWQDDAAFRSYVTALLANAPFLAFRWETPAVTARTVDRPFEFVLLDEARLSPARADASAFAAHLRPPAPPGAVVTFRNLGHDAVLVVPCPGGPGDAYAHLAAFVRQAPDVQRHALWRVASREMGARLGPPARLAEHRRDGRFVAPRPAGRPAEVLRLFSVPGRARGRRGKMRYNRVAASRP